MGWHLRELKIHVDVFVYCWPLALLHMQMKVEMSTLEEGSRREGGLQSRDLQVHAGSSSKGVDSTRLVSLQCKKSIRIWNSIPCSQSRQTHLDSHAHDTASCSVLRERECESVRECVRECESVSERVCVKESACERVCDCKILADFYRKKSIKKNSWYNKFNYNAFLAQRIKIQHKNKNKKYPS